MSAENQQLQDQQQKLQNQDDFQDDQDSYDESEGEVLTKEDFIDLFQEFKSVSKNYWNMIKQYPTIFSKQSLKPENFKDFKFDRSLIFYETPQEKMANNKFAKFAGDLKTRKWIYKDEEGQNKGPYDSEYINKFLQTNQIDENTRIAYQENDQVKQEDLKFIKIKKFLEKN